jgi:poly(A) polymerase
MQPHVERIKPLAEAFAARGFEMFFVGGCVRDAFMSRPVIDIDLTTNARPDSISELLTPVADTVWQVGAKFGTVGGLVNGTKVEITTYRSDVYQQGSRKPEVVFGNSLADDLKRRDFTVNAMALGVDLKDFVDPFDGLKSLGDKLLVTPIEPEKSFSDDPLRMMRAARFVSQHDFQIDPRVLAAMQAMADSITVVSAERVRDELDLILLSPNPEAGLRVLVETGLADRVLPELSGMQSTEDEHKLHKDVYQHSLQVLRHAIVLETEHEPRLQPDLILRLAALLHDIAKPATKKVSKSGQVTFHHHEVVGARMARNRLKALRYPNDVIEKVSRLVELHLRFHGYADGDWTDSAVRRYVRDADDLLIHLHKLTRADCTTRNKRKALDLQKTYSELEKRIGVLAAEEELAAIRPDLNGSQIMEILSIPPGREVGNAYEYMLELRLERGPMSFEDARDALLDWWRKR